MPNSEEIENIKRQLEQYRKNLSYLLDQAAAIGGEQNASLKLHNDIDEQRRCIREKKAMLGKLVA